MKFVFLTIALVCSGMAYSQSKPMYQKGWIDFNKNGKKDVFEDPNAHIDDRIEDILSQMNASNESMVRFSRSQIPRISVVLTVTQLARAYRSIKSLVRRNTLFDEIALILSLIILSGVTP